MDAALRSKRSAIPASADPSAGSIHGTESAPDGGNASHARCCTAWGISRCRDVLSLLRHARSVGIQVLQGLQSFPREV